ncbi:MAG: transcription antitermination factor NusB [Firmicutes bacterium]|nr:transcription antitermination factor NusB [Clostridiales bacterium]MDD6764514.1 transcription antitermination factor NusB [Bacillota bacterium]MDY5606638.1 transcription antitermination factor NusB [Lentihominibacter sp.]MDD6979809.1 transcription antitermination factor NusB [Bacillota bacterium]MDD7130593.1 transcription antitermination factor NusB [Bacillota bacterium]
MTRNEAREIMMQILYELDASKTIEKDKTDNLADTRAKAAALASERLSGGHIKRGTDLICSILDNLKDIDSSINEFSAKWKTSRMPKVDLAIMRLAIGEIRFSEDIPEPVSVNEAINLAKKFSTDNSARFIHGILGAVTGK